MSSIKKLKITHKNESKAYLTEFENKTESEIWDAFRAGNRNALVFIYQAFRDELFTYGYQFSKDKEKTKDKIQELFLYLFKNVSRLGPTTSIKFYLYRSLKRLQAKDPSNKVFNIPFSDYIKDSFSIELSHETILIKEEESEWKLLRLQDALNRLPLRQREVIYYFFYEGFSYKEIQEIMGYKNIQIVRNLQYKAIKALKEDLGGLVNYSTNELLVLVVIFFQLF